MKSMHLVSLLLATVLTGPSAVAPVASPLPALAAFAACWSRITGYTATLTMHEIAGTAVQDRQYALTFNKPMLVTAVVVKGPGRGGRVDWDGGSDVVGSPPGIFSGLKLHLPLDSPRVTTLRGDTIAMAPFSWVLDHFRQTAGTTSTAPGSPRDGVPTTQITLAVADPAADGGLTREVLVLSNATNLPVEVQRYVGEDLVKDIRYSDVVLR